MLEFFKAGGWLMYPLLVCSLLASAIIAERFWTLQKRRVLPRGLVAQVWEWVKTGKLDKRYLENLRCGSPLGKVLVAGLVNRNSSREVMKESIEEVGAEVVHELGRYLNMLGTIASISPLLGLLGTVVGMIDVFATITTEGVGNASALAGGISTALITTATGLSVAIPALLFYRYFRGRVDDLVITMEQESLKMIDVLQSIRDKSELEGS
ncbi:MAG: MotA/TolQ/ExbB proton channel family protein [Gammaproteobacteria bacterium]|nr:MotA/TolQ/ExbB proton channel family protein [Gammaproteobacteria bacterium]